MPCCVTLGGMTNQEDWPRLGDYLSRRIDELALTQPGVQRRGGPSPAKIREIINGRASVLSLSKRRDLERAIQWGAGSVDSILDGKEPTLVGPSRTRRDLAQRIVDAPTTAHDEHFERAERLLIHSQESVRQGDYLGAIRGLEGAESTIELLIDRITDSATEGNGNALETAPKSATPPETGQVEEDESLDDSQSGLTGTTRLEVNIEKMGVERADEGGEKGS